MLQKLSLKQRMGLLSGGFLAILILFAAYAASVINQIRIGSESYTDIVNSKNMVADILPPPLFAVEAQAVAAAIMENPDHVSRDDLLAKLGKLREDALARQAYWKGIALPAELRGEFQNLVVPSALAYLDYANQDFKQAILAGDDAARGAAFGELSLRFTKNYADVIKLSATAERYLGVKEADSVAASQAGQNGLIISVLIATLLSAGLGLAITRQILRELGADPRALKDVVNRVAAGDLGVDLALDDKAQGSVNHGLADMLASLKAFAAEATANARIKSALDNVSSNVMIADAGCNIIYMNPAVHSMFQRAEAEIRRDLPQFDARNLLGQSVDRFHKNPAHQRGLLANLNGTYKAPMQLGGRSFVITANPVLDDAGERLGSVVEWLDRTQEVAAENEVANLVQAASQGDFTRRIAVEGKDGFFKALAEGLNSLVDTSARGLAEIARVLGAVSQGNLTERIETDYAGTYGELKAYSNNTVDSLSLMMRQIRESAMTVTSASTEIAAGNADLSARTEQQAANLEETASSMEELTSTVRQNADNARQANQLAQSASQIATRGGAVVGDVVTTMTAINDSARKIADIISVIDGIAFQTNILALNAAVEAARAGEQGRGFAVVAGEVRNLAQRSASAAKEIKALITDSANKVESGNKLVETAGTTMQEIVTAIRRVTDIMSEIAAASEEQSSGIEQVNAAVMQMDEMTQQNAALVEEASAAAESLREQADLLADAVAVFRFDAGGILTSQRVLAAPEPQRAAPVPLPARASASRAPAKPARAKKAKVEEDWEEF